ncbi:hypothetical protein BH23CHL5_BH23CHL5_07110 [soil metagenome]
MESNANQNQGTDLGGAVGHSDNVQPDEQTEPKSNSRMKLWAILAGVGLVALFALSTFGLYQLGDDSQSSLERLRDIAVIFIVVMSLLIVILMAAGTAALIFLLLQIKNKIIPMLEELTGTINRVRGTTEFMSEEAIKPVISAAGRAAQIRAMARVITGRGFK